MKNKLKNTLFLVLMLTAAGLAIVLRPTQRVSDEGTKLVLESLVPVEFGDWKLDKTVEPIQASDYLQSISDKIYSQTLARTYINGVGYRIMLSIAYGGSQNDDLQVHRPEICYAAQGFQVHSGRTAEVFSTYGQIPVKRLLTSQGNRIELITYWVTVGDKLATTGFEQKLAQMSYGLSGKVPDGMLVRFSSIDSDESRAFTIQDEFVRQMLAVVSPEFRNRLIGR